MSLPLSSRVARVQASATVEINALALARRSAGEDVISLAAGEPDFDTPAHIAAAAVDAIRAGHTHYTPLAGVPALREAVAEKFARDNDLTVDPADVLVSCGGKQLIYNAALAVMNPGDQAIVIAPYWVSYPDIVKLADGEPVFVTTTPEQQFKVQPEALDAALGERTRLIFLNSPGNPCGNVYSRAELAALGDVLRRYPDVLVLSDEIYEHLCWGEQASLSLPAVCPDLADRTLVVNGVSKCYAMTGWRLGFGAGPRALMTEMRKLQGQQTTNACSVSQYAAIAALNGSLDEVHRMRDVYARRALAAVDLINGVHGLRCDPVAGAFYLMVDSRALIEAKGLGDDVALCRAILAESGVACVPGTAFGAPGFMRLSFACDDAIFADAVGRIGEYAGR